MILRQRTQPSKVINMSKKYVSKKTKLASKKKFKNKFSSKGKGFGGSTKITKSSVPMSLGYTSKVGDVRGGSSIIKKKEYIMDVTPKSSRFRLLKSNSDGIVTALSEIAGNLGLTASFPWLSSIAPAFEQFAFKTCNFLFKPSCPTTTNGSVSLVPMYDSSSEFGSSKESIINNVGASRSPAWQENSCKLDPKKLNSAFKSHKIRTGPVGPNEDIKTTDPFKLGVFLDEGATDAAKSLGELWVDYEVELKIPKSTSGFNYNTMSSIVVTNTGAITSVDYGGKDVLKLSTDASDPDFIHAFLRCDSPDIMFGADVSILGDSVAVTSVTFTLFNKVVQILYNTTGRQSQYSFIGKSAKEGGFNEKVSTSPIYGLIDIKFVKTEGIAMSLTTNKMEPSELVTNMFKKGKSLQERMPREDELKDWLEKKTREVVKEQMFTDHMKVLDKFK